MINHYLLLIYRNFLRAKSYFLINLIGLSTGLACTMLIYLWVSDEQRMDKFHEKDSRLFQVMEHQQYATNIMTTTSTPGVLAEALKAEVPEVEYAATTTWISSFTLSVGDHSVKGDGYYVGKDFFNIFSYGLTEGNADQVLEDKYSLVISRPLAVKLFGTDENIIGKMVDLQHDKSLRITGIFEELPKTSSYKFEFVMPFELFRADNEWVAQWGN